MFFIMVLCFFLSACGQVKTVYEQIPMELCPHAPAPVLPRVRGDLENEITQRILIEREKQVRAYVERLRMTVECYEKQVTQ